MKIYIIYFDWKNTSGNHAGMAYLAKQLENKLSSVITIRMISSKYKLLRVLNFFYSVLLVLYFKIILRKQDKVFLMEYMARGSFQDFFALLSSKIMASYTTVGLVHLSGSHLMEIYKSKKVIRNKLNYVNKIIVFGSSLENFIQSLNINNHLLRTFHYVDVDFYQPRNNYLSSSTINNPLEIICIGNLKRDFDTLKKIIIQCKDQTFHICQGFKDLSAHFKECPNVVLYNFLSEKDLLNLMQSADISLSIMDDTIGSNVITTSLACGLVQVVSDVGSIRDYCTPKNTIFCSSVDEYVKAIKLLSKDSELLLKMKENARFHSSNFALAQFIFYFNNKFLCE